MCIQVSVNMLQGMVVTATALTGINTYAVCYLVPLGQASLLSPLLSTGLVRSI